MAVTIRPATEAIAFPEPNAATNIIGQHGLSSEEARHRLTLGSNVMADVSQHPVHRALGKLWAPVPWMLEAAIVLQLFLGDYVEAGVVALLLVANAAIGFFQEGRAQATLDALKSQSGASCGRATRWNMDQRPGGNAGCGRLGEIVARLHRRRGRAPSRWIDPGRSVDAHGRVSADRGRRGRGDLCWRPDTARRGSRRSHRDWDTHQVRTDGGTRAKRESRIAPSRRPFCASCAIWRCSTGP